MKTSELLIYVLGITGALAGYFLLQPPLSWAAVGVCAAFTVWTLFAADAAAKPVLRLVGLSWSMEDFVRGWLRFLGPFRSKLEVPDWPLDRLPKLPRKTPPPLPPESS
jgi:hypothetical protein